MDDGFDTPIVPKSKFIRNLISVNFIRGGIPIEPVPSVYRSIKTIEVQPINIISSVQLNS